MLGSALGVLLITYALADDGTAAGCVRIEIAFTLDFRYKTVLVADSGNMRAGRLPCPAAV